MMSTATTFFWRAIIFFQTYSGAVTAVATIFIGIFTWVLACVTNRQARLTRDTIKLARDEFIATHRPKVLIQSAIWSDNGKIVDFTAINAGETTAQIKSYMIFIYIKPDDSVFLPSLNEPEATILQNPISLEPGERVVINARSKDPGQSYTSYWAISGARMFTIGRLEYEGIDLIRRVTGFCREYDRDRGMWYAVQNSELEYAY